MDMVEPGERVVESPVEPDYTFINAEVLKTHPLPLETEVGDNPPITVIGDQDLSAITPREDVMLPEREYVVDVEYSSENYALRTQSLRRYYSTFEEAKISQETIAQMVHKHLKAALETSLVFVEVKSETGKRTRIGSVL